MASLICWSGHFGAAQLQRLEPHGGGLDAEAAGVRRHRRAIMAAAGAAARFYRWFATIGHLALTKSDYCTLTDSCRLREVRIKPQTVTAITFRRLFVGVWRHQRATRSARTTRQSPPARRNSTFRRCMSGSAELHRRHGDHGLRQPIYRELQALDVHQQLELRMRQKVAAQEVLQLATCRVRSSRCSRRRRARARRWRRALRRRFRRSSMSARTCSSSLDFAPHAASSVAAISTDEKFHGPSY